MIDKEIYDALRKLIIKETVWLRHYVGEVLDVEDEDGLGKILVASLDLGFTTKEKALWCSPRNLNSMSLPAVGDWVEFYFMGGNRNLPVWVGLANEIQDVIVKNFDGKATSHVLFEDPDDDARFILYDSKGKTLKQTMEEITATLKLKELNIECDNFNVKGEVNFNEGNFKSVE